jgi:hypothetical protein
MIKQNFDIDSNEVLRILNLHETATKNYYILKEQTEVVTGIDKKTEEKKFPTQKLGDKFEYGVYDSPSVKSEIQRLKPQIEDFINKTDANKFIVNVSAGESQVTNPKGFEVKGSLALERAKSVKKYFEEIFPDLVKKGTLVISIPPDVDHVKIGETPYKKGDQNKPEKKQKYREEQFVNFDITGSGVKTTEVVKTKFLCNTKPLSNEGGYLMADSNFTQVVPWKLNRGEGLVNITFETFYMPDIIYFEYDGKIYGDSLFRGATTDPYRIFLGTSLRSKFGTAGLPAQMGDNKVTGMNSNDPRIMDSLDEMKKWGLAESFQNTFGPKSSLSNNQYMDAFNRFDRSGNKRRLLSDLGEYFPWGILSSKMGNGVHKIGPIQKIDGVDEIKVYNVAPVGTTKWKIYLNCETPK